MKDLCVRAGFDVDKIHRGRRSVYDVTMSVFKNKGKEKKDKDMIREKTFPAELDALDEAIGWIEAFLEEADCPMKHSMQIAVAAEEIFVNIAKYAYTDSEEKRTAYLKMETIGDGVSLTFADGGVPFNPLEREDPDTTLSAEERKIGGLGIYMVKKTMDETEYRYEDGKNIFTIRKKF